MTQRRQGVPFVLSAPSGAGKTTVCKGVIARDAGIVVSVSHTTRAPRPGERDGVEYHFVSSTEFRKLVAEGAFLEHAEYSGNLYGTSWAAIDAPLARGEDVLLEIETEGARLRHARGAAGPLKRRVGPACGARGARQRGRGTEGAEEVDRRLAIARREFATASLFDSFVVNEDAKRAVDDVLAIVAALRAGALAQLGDRFSLARLRKTLDPALAAWLPC